MRDKKEWHVNQDEVEVKVDWCKIHDEEQVSVVKYAADRKTEGKSNPRASRGRRVNGDEKDIEKKEGRASMFATV
jgi:hypothetical protein